MDLDPEHDLSDEITNVPETFNAASADVERENDISTPLHSRTIERRGCGDHQALLDSSNDFIKVMMAVHQQLAGQLRNSAKDRDYFAYTNSLCQWDLKYKYVLKPDVRNFLALWVSSYMDVLTLRRTQRPSPRTMARAKVFRKITTGFRKITIDCKAYTITWRQRRVKVRYGGGLEDLKRSQT